MRSWMTISPAVLREAPWDVKAAIAIRLARQDQRSTTRPADQEAEHSLAYFVEATVAWKLDPWQQVLCNRLSRLATERGQRILVHAPPQIGKSILVSQRFPAWLLARRPTERIKLAAYNITHATRFARIV